MSDNKFQKELDRELPRVEQETVEIMHTYQLPFEDAAKLAMARLAERKLGTSYDKASSNIKRDIADKLLIDFVTSGPTTGNHPYDNNGEMGEIYVGSHRRHPDILKKSDQQLATDIKISKQVVDQLVNDAQTKTQERASAEKLLEESIKREHVENAYIIDVKGMSASEAAERVLAFKTADLTLILTSSIQVMCYKTSSR